jgi:hypothetical protein
MLRSSLGKVVHTVKRAGTYAAKVPPQELHKITVHVRAVDTADTQLCLHFRNSVMSGYHINAIMSRLWRAASLRSAPQAAHIKTSLFLVRCRR